MKKSDIYEIAIKILAIYMFFVSIDLLRGVIFDYITVFQAENTSEFNRSYDTRPFLIVGVVNLLIEVLFATLLILKTKAIVKIICDPSDYNENASLFADRKVIYEIALIIMGLFLIIWTIPDFGYRLKDYFQMTQNKLPTKYDTNFLVIASLKIIVGFTAVACAKPISRVIAKNQST